MSYDFIVVGSGIAGLYTALLAQRLGSVLILTKGNLDECNTRYAQGGIAAALAPLDSASLHVKDTLRTGDGLCDTRAVRILAAEASDRILDLVRMGVMFDTVNGEIALTQEGGHSLARVAHAGGDATGACIESALSHLARSSSIDILENHLVTELCMERGAVCGVQTLDCRSGALRDFSCRSVVLATGGAGQLFAKTTNPAVATGDGVALAFRAGAELTDMEFFQFHPTALCIDGAPPFLISEAVRGEGGILLNDAGERFMLRYEPRGELASRDIVSRAMVNEMTRTGASCVYLDVSHLPHRRITARFPNIYSTCLEWGIDITRQTIPVAPAAHYMIGGVRTNTWGETSLRGLYACGEVACTGVHGANRLASNSLLEVMVFGKRLVERAARAARRRPRNVPHEPIVMTAQSHRRGAGPADRRALQQLLWQHVGIMRDREHLLAARAQLMDWRASLPVARTREEFELSHLLLVALVMANAALTREESRGAHYRSDFPGQREEWRRHLTYVFPPGGDRG